MKLLTTFFFCICFCISGYNQTDTLCTGAVGDVKWSVLDPEEFQKVNGDCWILMDGRNIASSKLGAMGFSKVPDGEGMFLRAIDMRTSGRQDPDRSKGTNPGDIQGDAIKAHDHNYEDIYYSESPGFIASNALPNTTRFPASDRIGSNDNDHNNEYWQINRKSETFGGSETRPKNIALYLYIRIN